MTARADPPRPPSSRGDEPTAWGWGSGAWGWGPEEDDSTVDTEQDPTDEYAISGVADTGPAAGSSAYLIVRFLSEFLTE